MVADSGASEVYRRIDTREHRRVEHASRRVPEPITLFGTGADKSRDGVTRLAKLLDQRCTDETGSTGDSDMHDRYNRSGAGVVPAHIDVPRT